MFLTYVQCVAVLGRNWMLFCHTCQIEVIHYTTLNTAVATWYQEWKDWAARVRTCNLRPSWNLPPSLTIVTHKPLLLSTWLSILFLVRFWPDYRLLLELQVLTQAACFYTLAVHNGNLGFLPQSGPVCPSLPHVCPSLPHVCPSLPQSAPCHSQGFPLSSFDRREKGYFITWMMSVST